MGTTLQVTDLRNIALVGHGATGKTTLADLMLFKAGIGTRPGSVDDGSSRLDIDDEERQHHFSVSSHLVHFKHLERTINLLDTPGYPDFIGQVVGALRGVETVCIVINAAAGIEANTRRVFQLSAGEHLGKIIVLNKLDQEQIHFRELVQEIQAAFGKQCVLLNMPDQVGPGFSRVISTLDVPAELPPGLPFAPEEVHQSLMDAVVECDEEMMNRYLNGERFAEDELFKCIEYALAAGTLIPIVCCSARTGVGVPELMDVLAHDSLAPGDLHHLAVAADGHLVDVPADETAPFLAQVIKTRIDPFVSRMNFLRIFSGTLRRDDNVFSERLGKNIRITGLYHVQGGHAEPIDVAVAGDIVAVVKIDDLRIGDSVSDGRNGHLQFPPIPFPAPMTGLGIEPRSRGDQQKISVALHRISEEDPTFTSGHERSTHELVMHGMSELHLKIIEERLHAREKVDILTHPPKIAYREAPTIAAQGMYRHRKQTGGAGQFAEVHLRIRPFPPGTDAHEFCTAETFPHLRAVRHHAEFNAVFVDCISGGSIPNQFIPAVEKGVVERLERGALAGFPIQNVAVELFFGKYHAVDSNENAFRTAGSHCFRDVFKQSKPGLLEPVYLLRITFPPEKFGDIAGDLTTRRGRVDATESGTDGTQVITARVPGAELHGYSRSLSSLTGGQGSFTVGAMHYDILPMHHQTRVLSTLTALHEET